MDQSNDEQEGRGEEIETPLTASVDARYVSRDVVHETAVGQFGASLRGEAERSRVNGGNEAGAEESAGGHGAVEVVLIAEEVKGLKAQETKGVA